MNEELDLLPVGPESPTPHFDKLTELLNNLKLPGPDADSVRAAIGRYHDWVRAMDAVDADGDERVVALVGLLNEYKRFVEVEVIWDSEADFLYRQRGQLKLDNSIIEEFLPRLIDPRIIPALEGKAYAAGPRRSFAAVYFTTTLTSPLKGAGLQVRTKDQDFTVSREAYLRSSFDPSFPDSDTVTSKVHLAFVAAECKTNLDKTMFQEATATAHDLKVGLPGARYYLLIEWLDMTPISTRATDIDEVIILRGKRMGSNIRGQYASGEVRRQKRDEYLTFLDENPIRVDRVLRLVQHVGELLGETAPEEDDVLLKGYF